MLLIDHYLPLAMNLSTFSNEPKCACLILNRLPVQTLGFCVLSIPVFIDLSLGDLRRSIRKYVLCFDGTLYQLGPFSFRIPDMIHCQQGTVPIV